MSKSFMLVQKTVRSIQDRQAPIESVRAQRAAGRSLREAEGRCASSRRDAADQDSSAAIQRHGSDRLRDCWRGLGGWGVAAAARACGLQGCGLWGGTVLGHGARLGL